MIWLAALGLEKATNHKETAKNIKMRKRGDRAVL